LASCAVARKSTLADNPLFITANPGSSRMPGAFRPRVPFETALKELMHPACASQTFLNPSNLQLRRVQARRRSKAAVEAAATIFWALASLIATTVAAFA
jgi:hypothetical protein